MLNQFERAIGPGRVAIQMASELEAWDYYGVACLFLGGAYTTLRQYQTAIDAFLNYHASFHKYRAARRYQVWGWYNLGHAYSLIGEGRQAAKSLAEALKLAEAAKNERFAHGVRQALIEQCVRIGDAEQVPELLAKCSHYLRHHADEYYIRESRLAHLKLRAEYAVLTNRLDRAFSVALRGLSEAGREYPHLCHFHLLLAKIARQKGATIQALGHAMSARVYASKGSRYDLESEASELFYEVIKSNPEDLAGVDRYYLGTA